MTPATPPSDRPLRPGEYRTADLDSEEPGTLARESEPLTRGLDAMNESEWRTIALELAQALRDLQQLLLGGGGRVPHDAPVTRTMLVERIENALASVGLDR